MGWLIGGGLALLAVGGLLGAFMALFGLGFWEGFSGSFGTSGIAVTYGPAGDLSAFDLAVGSCAMGHPDDIDAIEQTDAVSCEESHGMETFARVEPPSLGEESPLAWTRDDLSRFADEACLVSFEAYVGETYDNSQFDYYAVIPSEPMWASGTKTIHCLLFDFDGNAIDGSARLSHR
jgi:hypothetical protein